MTSLVAEFLRQGGTLESLAAQYAVRVSRHRRYPNLVGLKYSQIDSPLEDPIARECRGIVLDEADNWRVVARGFDKFFNYGEPNATPIDWATAQVQEKLDGSLILLYWYRDEWHVGTTGSPDASGRVTPTWAGTFADLFWQTARAQGIVLPTSEVSRRVTYLLELMSPLNRVVVSHKAARVVLLAIRHPATGEEQRPTPSSLPGIPLVRHFPLQTWEDIRASFDQFNPLEQEGYVIVDANFNRIKVKHPGYVALHHLRDSLAPKAFLDVIRRNEADEVRAAFPEIVAQFKPVEDRFEALVAELEAEYARLKDIPIQKDFALEAVKTRFPAALFALRAQRTPSIRAFLASIPLDSAAKVVGLEEAMLASAAPPLPE